MGIPVQSVRDVTGLYPKNGLPPTPPYLWKSFFDHFILCNLNEINSLHFCHVDESVTANPRFCPFLAPKRADLTPKTHFFEPFFSKIQRS
jgi:hypothetical protein